MQTETGTKDKITQHWIDILLEKAKEMKKKDPDCALESVVDELCTWLKEQPGDKINPLLDIPGMALFFYEGAYFDNLAAV